MAPCRAIRAAVELVIARFTPQTSGVHMRRGDAWAIGDSYRRASSDQALFDRVDDLLAGFPDGNVFLATDSEETQSRMLARYGRAIVVNPNKTFVPSVRAQHKVKQRDAVIDPMALSQTSKILGSNGSTFLPMAADIGGVELGLVVERRRHRRAAAHPPSDHCRWPGD